MWEQYTPLLNTFLINIINLITIFIINLLNDVLINIINLLNILIINIINSSSTHKADKIGKLVNYIVLSSSLEFFCARGSRKSITKSGEVDVYELYAFTNNA